MSKKFMVVPFWDMLTESEDLINRALDRFVSNHQLAEDLWPTLCHSDGCMKNVADGQGQYSFLSQSSYSTSGALVENSPCIIGGGKVVLGGNNASLKWISQEHGKLVVERFVNQHGCQFTIKIKGSATAKPLKITLQNNKLHITSLEPQSVEGGKGKENKKTDNRPHDLLERARYYLHRQLNDNASEQVEKVPFVESKPFVMELVIPREGLALESLNLVLVGKVLLPSVCAESFSEVQPLKNEEETTADVTKQLKNGESVLVHGARCGVFIEISKSHDKSTQNNR